MPTLNLGVHDAAYAAIFTTMTPNLQRPGWMRRVTIHTKTLSRAQRAYGTGRTTGQIASILEARYGIMRAYYDNRKANVILPAIERSVKGALINIMNGQPGVVAMETAAMFRITEDFQEALSMKRFDSWISRGGTYPVPTLASQGGVSMRHKSGFTKGKLSRPSFINTGFYQSSFVTWMS